MKAKRAQHLRGSRIVHPRGILDELSDGAFGMPACPVNVIRIAVFLAAKNLLNSISAYIC